MFFHNVFVHPALSKLCKSRRPGFTGRRNHIPFQDFQGHGFQWSLRWCFLHEYVGLMARDLLLNVDLARGH